MAALDRLSGTGGTYFCQVTTAHTGLSFSAIVINTDAVFTTLTITDGAGTTYNALLTTAPYGQNLSGRTVKAGMMITAPEGSRFTALTMSSGTCIGVITRSL
ncbi:MAG: hypothetical protein ACK5P0_00850 [bacterium]|jgi:hypothetical protein